MRTIVLKLFLAEVDGLLVRFMFTDTVRETLRTLKQARITLGDDLYFNDSIGIAPDYRRERCRLLLHWACQNSRRNTSHQQKKAINAKRAGIPADYVLEELEDLNRYLEC